MVPGVPRSFRKLVAALGLRAVARIAPVGLAAPLGLTAPAGPVAPVGMMAPAGLVAALMLGCSGSTRSGPGPSVAGASAGTSPGSATEAGGGAGTRAAQVITLRIAPPPPAKPPGAAAGSLGTSEGARVPTDDDGAEDEEDEADEGAPLSTGRAWLGVELRAAPPGTPGVGVAHVVAGSPAERAGLKDGEVILELDGQVVSSPNDVVQTVAQRRPGTRVAVMARGAHGDRPVGVTLEPFPRAEQLHRMQYVGKPAPGFSGLQPATGSLAPTLVAHRGKVVVVEFWASWCMVCRSMVPVLNDWQARFGAGGVEVLGVTEDPVRTAAQHATSLGMAYATFSDGGGATTAAYRAHALPTLFVVDRQGVVRDVVVGYDPRRLREAEALLTQLVARP